MSAAKTKLRAVPAPSSDPIADAQVAVTRAVEQRARALEALTAQRRLMMTAQDRFDSGDQAVTVVDLAHQRELLSSAERKHQAAEDAEHKARIELTNLEKQRDSAEYDARVARVLSWRSRMGNVLARLAAVDEEVARIVEEAADVIADATTAHEEALALEASVRPVMTLRTRNIEAPSLTDARHLAQVHIARVRAKAGRDELGDGWISGLSMPHWQDGNRERWNAANKALDEIEQSKEQSK